MLELPTHYCIERTKTGSVGANEAREFVAFSHTISAIERSHDVMIIDAPGSGTYLMRLAHSPADTLVTLLNDSLVGFEVRANVDPAEFYRLRREPLPPRWRARRAAGAR